MSGKAVSNILKVIIWLCLGVILFSALYVSSKLFFPFIVTKTVAFNISVEVMFLAFLLLSLLDKNYKIRLNLTVILMLVYLGILTLASLLGNDFYHSFWSNNERSDGILLLGHLFLFVVVLTSFIRTTKEWLYVLDIFLAASFCVSIVALDQYFAMTFPGQWLDHFLPSSNGARLAATIGNAGYVAGYMIFGVFISLFLFFKRKSNWLKVLYAIVFFLELFIAIETQTRGGYLALALGLPIFILYLVFFYYKKNYLKIIGIILILAGLGCTLLIFANKNSDFIKNQPILNRITSISLSDGSTNNRLVTWGIAFSGFKDRPILGYGQENFYQVFDRYYTTKNTEQWFDRSHNMIGDRVITGGILGLVSYLSLLILPFYFLWGYYRKKYKDINKDQNKDKAKESAGRLYFTPVIFSILILAYIIQNLFIFEALVTYVPLMLVLSFAGLYGPSFEGKLFASRSFKVAIFVIFLIAFVPMLYFFNIKPVQANADLIKILSSSGTSIDQRISSFEDIISRHTLGNQEYRRQYFNFYEEAMSYYFQGDSKDRNKAAEEQLASFTSKMEGQLLDQINENPNNVTNYLMLIRFYNMAYIFDPTMLSKSIKLSNTALELSSGRPQIYYELATAYYYTGYYQLASKQPSQGTASFALALDSFYRGAKQNVNNGDAFGQLAGFLLSVKGNKDLMSALVARGISGQKVEAVTAEMITWISSDQQQEQMKEILKAILALDDRNSELKKQLESLK
ncbi:MAG: O-antigen ligase family protein [Patescibacteria group bacterium]